MKIDVLFAPTEIGERELNGRVAAVIDVLRATSTIVEAIANGARAIVPAADIEMLFVWHKLSDAMKSCFAENAGQVKSKGSISAIRHWSSLPRRSLINL